MKTKNYFKKAMLLFLVCSTQLIKAQVPNYVPTNGLVGYWPFNGNANDASGNANNGINNGATLTTDRFGNINSAYSFDGINNFIEVAHSSTQNFSDGQTVSFWIYRTGFIPAGGDQNHIISKGAQLFNGQNIWAGDADNYIVYHYISGNYSTSNGCGTASNSFSNNSWLHYVVTNDLNVMKIYQNGDLVQTCSLSNPSTTLAGTAQGPMNFGKGRGHFGNEKGFNGNIDDIGIWNRALTSQEVSNMYNQVTPYSDTCNAVSGSLTQGLVGYWPFCGNANDDSGNGNNGTVNGATLTTDRFGNSNAAYSFNGINNYVEIPNSAIYNNSNYTFSFWVKTSLRTNYLGGPNVNQGIIGRLQTGGPASTLGSADNWVIYEDSGTCALGTAGGTGGANAQTFINNQGACDGAMGCISDNNWHHIVFTVSSTEAKAYFDGLLKNTVTYSTPITYQSYVTRIGRVLNTYWRSFQGVVDDFGIWNRSLTTQEITQLYNQNQCFTNTTVTDTLVINVGQLSYTNPINYANNITIYPNPASTQVNIAFNNITNLNGGIIKIINSLGQQVATTPITTSGTNTTMTLSTWGGSGLYFVQILNPQGQIVDIKKILLQ